jgi:hypothetical protein
MIMVIKAILPDGKVPKTGEREEGVHILNQ